MPDRILLVGASAGIGAALAVEMARPGRKLALVARRRDELEKVAALARARGAEVIVEVADAADASGVEATWRKLDAALGGVDTLVYAAGVMPPVAPDEFDTAKDAQVIEVNVLGATAWLNAAARDFGQRGGGTICGIGSVAGDRGRRPHPAYGASKAYLHALLESMHGRLWQKGVRVVTIKPGPVDTAMMRGLGQAGKPPLLISAEVAAKRIAQAIDRGETVVYVPAPWRLIMAVIRSLPGFVFKHFAK